jgi:hypothetical protein
MKKALSAATLAGLVFAIGYLTVAVFAGSRSHAAPKPSFHSVKEASAALVSYVSPRLADQGAVVAATKCAPVALKRGRYVLAPASAKFGCLLDVRLAADPSTTVQCISVVFDFPADASKVSHTAGNAMPLADCR